MMAILGISINYAAKIDPRKRKSFFEDFKEDKRQKYSLMIYLPIFTIHHLIKTTCK